MSSQLSPFVYWAQTKEHISLRVDLKEVRGPSVLFKDNELHFQGLGLGARGIHEYAFNIKFDRPLQKCRFRVFDRCVEISLEKVTPEWWERIIDPAMKKPAWLKVDFEKWRSEEDDEVDKPDVFEDYPDLYDKLMEEETGKKFVRNSRKLYLFMYNLWQLIAFGYVLVHLGLKYSLNKEVALKTSWEAVGWQMNMNTLMQFIEIAHALLGWTRGNAGVSFVQTFGRFFFLVVLIDSEERMQPLPATFYLVVVYAAVEMFRYSYYMFHVYDIHFEILTWLRYTVWIPLYPLGFFLEAFVAFRSISYFEETRKYSVGLPNAWNFAFHLPSFVRVYLLLFCFPMMYVMMGHMNRQRRKVLGSRSKRRD